MALIGPIARAGSCMRAARSMKIASIAASSINECDRNIAAWMHAISRL
jgi:hypothetical protein